MLDKIKSLGFNYATKSGLSVGLDDMVIPASKYTTVDEADKKVMQDIKDMGLAFHEYLNVVGNSREISLAQTRIEEAVMWAVKHVTR
jgi:DNA-directed RNA polymerase beta' subunit